MGILHSNGLLGRIVTNQELWKDTLFLKECLSWIREQLALEIFPVVLVTFLANSMHLEALRCCAVTFDLGEK